MSVTPIPVTPAQVKEALAQTGSIHKAAKTLGISYGTAHSRLSLGTPPSLGLAEHPGRLEATIDCGQIVIASDAHIWPGEPTPGARALTEILRLVDPEILVLNGDVFDGSAISRWPRVGWEKQPTIVEELGAAQAQLRSWRRAGKRAKARRHIWPLGNHDARFETRIANALPELAGVTGVHLKDHFPDWEPCWAVWINDEVCIKHRWHGGVYSARNNVLKSGTTIVTGHDHKLEVIPWTDYRGTRWGVCTGMLGQPYTHQFVHYTEANPCNWRVGGVVLTFNNGRLMWPELFWVFDANHFEFRGKAYELA